MIDADSIQYTVGSPFVEDITSLEIDFELNQELDQNDGCFIKYTFPSEIDI